MFRLICSDFSSHASLHMAEQKNKKRRVEDTVVVTGKPRTRQDFVFTTNDVRSDLRSFAISLVSLSLVDDWLHLSISDHRDVDGTDADKPNHATNDRKSSPDVACDHSRSLRSAKAVAPELDAALRQADAHHLHRVLGANELRASYLHKRANLQELLVRLPAVQGSRN
mgnify:CR=1 FL=1